MMIDRLNQFMRHTLSAGIGAMGVQGALRLAKGIWQKKATDVVNGGFQAAVGAVGIALVYLDSQFANVLAQASTAALTGSFVVKLGLHDLVRGRYGKGLCKLLLGLGGIASATYCVYSEWVKGNTLPASRIDFLKAHRVEINEMYERKQPVGNWAKLGDGYSKVVFEHPDLPGMVIKIPLSKEGYRIKTEEGDLMLHYENLQQIKKIAASFDQIVLPEAHLYQTQRGLLLVEEKLNLENLPDPDSYFRSKFPDRLKASDQFVTFIRATGLCDLDPYTNSNAGMISNSKPTKIGIIDFDCRDTLKSQ